MNPKTIKCPKCKGKTFEITREKLSDRMFASDKLTATCTRCLYSESLYKIGEEK